MHERSSATATAPASWQYGSARRDDVHDDAALEHVRHAAFNGEGAGAGRIHLYSIVVLPAASRDRRTGDGNVSDEALTPRMLPRASVTVPGILTQRDLNRRRISGYCRL